MPRNDRPFLNLYKKLNQYEYTNQWEEHSDNRWIKEVLSHSSKNNTDREGYPDFIYVNDVKKLLILIELKTSISQHEKEAIPQIEHYLTFFNEKLTPIKNINSQYKKALEYLSDWNVLGLAISGDVLAEYSSKIDTFCLKIDAIENLNITEIHSEEDYENLFNNINLEEISSRITNSSSWINNLLYDVKEDKRPTLLSILLISLYQNSKKTRNHFKDDFEKYNPKELMDQIKITVPKILGTEGENIPQDKIDMIMREFETFANEKVLLETDTVKTILKELNLNVIPLFQSKHNYDIIGKFYQEFLRYAGIVDVQSGIILTPEHVTELFTNLIDLKRNDIIFDSCCGTGSFLISAMNKLLSLQSTDKDRENVRKNQLLGNELKSHMYILAISNMLFRGDGKSHILNCDFFSEEFDKEFKAMIEGTSSQPGTGKPTIGFINPPYSGSFTSYKDLLEFKKNDSKQQKNKNKKPWMKEISFLHKMCRLCTRYVVMIAPPQTFMSELDIRKDILKENTLKAVITMPKDLFQPNASTGSAIIIIETNKKHDYETPVVFYNLTSDGFELAKKKGRRDVYGKWNDIKKNLLNNINAPYYLFPKNVDNITNCHVKIKEDDEWLVQAHSKVDFDKIKDADFIKTIKEYSIYHAKRALDILDKNIPESTLLDIFDTISTKAKQEGRPELYKKDTMSILEIFKKPRGVKRKISEKELTPGDYNYITTSNKNYGFSGYHNEYCENENVFTVDSATEGKCFYQEYKFIGSDHVEILEPLDMYKDKINPYTAIYLQTLLNFYLDKYEYSRKRAHIRINKEKICVPKNINGEIDWLYMELYIKSLPYSSNI